MDDNNKGKRPTNSSNKAWNCGYCHSTNVTSLCGCKDSLAGRKKHPEPSLDSIVLEGL